MTRRPLVVRDGKQPFLVIVALLALVGAAGLVGPGFRSNAILSAWGPGYAVAWYALCLGFALYTIAAVFVPRALTRALQYEGSATTASLHVPGLRPRRHRKRRTTGLTAAGMFLGFAIGTGIRIRHIHVDLAKLSRLGTNPAPADPQVLADPGGDEV